MPRFQETQYNIQKRQVPPTPDRQYYDYVVQS